MRDYARGFPDPPPSLRGKSWRGLDPSLRAVLLHRVPPRADAFQALVIAFKHLHRRAHRLRERGPHIERGRIAATDGTEQSVMPPETRKCLQFLRLPCGIVDIATAPAILDKELGRRV